MRTSSALAGLLLLVACGGARASGGVPIVPDADGAFLYEDDFSTPRCLTDAFLDNTGVEVWRPGTLSTQGPHRRRTLTYRFHGDRVITGVEVVANHRTNARHLGGQTTLHMSVNGLDWVLVDDSKPQPGDANAWQTEPLRLAPEQEQTFTDRTEIWLRLVMDNYSGLKTYDSNFIEALEVRINTGDPPAPEADPQAALREAWGELRRAAGWRSITLDVADPDEARAPHYFEDADGWLRPPGDSPHLRTHDEADLPIRRAYLSHHRSPLSLVAYVGTRRSAAPLLARVRVTATRDSSRRLAVRWNGATAATFDVASFFPRERVFFARLEPVEAGTHELRLEPQDAGAVLVREVAVGGPGEPTWAPRPPLPDAPPLVVLSASYLPDPAPPEASQAVEGRHAVQEAGLIFPGLQRFYREHEDFGALRVILHNAGPHPVRIGDALQLNRRPIERSYVDFVKSAWDARGVVWHRVQPQLVAPGECSEVYVRFRRRPDGDRAVLRLPVENARPVGVEIPYEAPTVDVDYVTTDEARATLYVYIRPLAAQPSGGVAEVALNGRALSGAQVYGGDLREGIALVTAPLPAPLPPMSEHAVTVRTTGGEVVGAQFRVLPWVFPRSSIHVPSAMCAEMNMNMGMWHHRSLEECEEHDIITSTNTDRMFGAHERVRYILGPDEPDAADNRGGGYDRGLGSHARRLMDSGWTDLVRSQAPHVATWIIMNGTTRPLNWCVYGRFTDVASFDPYPVNFYGADHTYVRESMEYVRRCSTPRRMYACLEAFGWRAGQGVPRGARGPIPAEYRQNVVQALGAGTKGLTSWVYSAGAGGWQVNEPVRLEIARVNALISQVEDLLLLGTPVPWAATDAGLVPTGVAGDERWPKERVWAGALLCGPDAVVVAVANHIPAAKPEPPEIEPARDVTVTVQLPEYLREVEAFEATEEGLREVPCVLEEGRAFLRLDSIESGRMFVLRRR